MDSCQRPGEQSRRRLPSAARQAGRVIGARAKGIPKASVRRTHYNMFYTPFYRRICSIVSPLTPRWLSREHLKTVIAAAPRDDLEQTALRVGIVGAVLAYLCWHVMGDGLMDRSEIGVLAVTAG